MTDDRPRYMISVAADIVGMHQQTLRMYEAKGLVRPQRTAGNTRLYSEADLERLRVIQRLTTELGLNLAGVEHVLRLEDVPEPQAHAGMLRVQVDAVALNFPDVLLCRGMYQEKPELPFTPGKPMARIVFPIVVFLGRHVITRRNPIGRHAMAEDRLHGGPLLRVKRNDLAKRGVERVTERVVSVQEGLPVLEGGRVVEAANVVWCTGFRQAFDWVDGLVLDDHGWPQEYRGVVPDAPGLFFTGLAFQYSFSSDVLPGMSRDHAFVANHISSRAESRRRALPELDAAR